MRFVVHAWSRAQRNQWIGSRLVGKHCIRAHIEDGYQLQIFVAYDQIEFCH